MSGDSLATVTSSRTNSDGMLSKYSQFITCLPNKKCFIHSYRRYIMSGSDESRLVELVISGRRKCRGTPSFRHCR